MLKFILKRILLMIPTIIFISIISFIIVVLPPGDYVTTYVSNREASGESIDQAQVEALRERYGLNQPFYVQYWRWVKNIVTQGDFGYSLIYRQSISTLIWGRLGLTVVISLVTLVVTWLIAFPLGIYAAVRQYSWGDYASSVIGFLGLAIPDFLLALVLLVYSLKWFNTGVGGLFSPEYVGVPWSYDKAVDFLQHLWIPVLILATNGTASLIRIMRANLLDELQKPYVTTARLKGQRESVLLMRYPVRAAMNPFVSTLGWQLPALVSGSTIVATILNLPTTGPLLLNALLSEDMYLASAFIFMLSVLTVIGTLLSDLLLVWFDPRIRFES